MNKNIKNRAMVQRKNKITVLFLALIAAMSIFLLSMLKNITLERKMPSYTATINDRSLRGNIISADGYTLSSSQKTYQAVINGASVDPNKKEIFVKLFSIYSNISEEKIHQKFKNKKGKIKKGNIVLSRNITSRYAMQLKSLAYKLRKLGVFRSTKNRNGIEILYGLDIVENGEDRRFELKDVMSPILGYVGKKSEGRYTRPEGKKGLERNYNKYITSRKNGYLKGKRDVIGEIIHDKNSVVMKRVDGLDLHLNVPLALQRRIELIVDRMKRYVWASEIMVGVMESQTGRVLSLASTNRYDPEHIVQNDIPSLNPKFSEYPYEPGSVIKPITLAIALDHNVVTPRSWFKTYNGRFKIGEKRFITDDEKFNSLSVSGIIVHSSNIGISQVSWRLSGKDFRDGMINFGISKASGIDLSRDLSGQIKNEHLLSNKMHRANSSYGYGMTATFTQLLKAYSAFNNNGIAMTPRIVDYLQDARGSQYTLEPRVGDLKPIKKKTAKQVHNILVQVVKKGTGKNAIYPGLEIGGKTGTAHIAKHGHYVNEYHSSFYGFANDKKGHKYTIGVLVVKAKAPKSYFASKSAVPTFRRVLDTLVELDYLEPKDGIRTPAPELGAKTTTSEKIPEEAVTNSTQEMFENIDPYKEKPDVITPNIVKPIKQQLKKRKRRAIPLTQTKREEQPIKQIPTEQQPSNNKQPFGYDDDLF